jgi:hypothetical protein
MEEIVLCSIGETRVLWRYLGKNCQACIGEVLGGVDGVFGEYFGAESDECAEDGH